MKLSLYSKKFAGEFADIPRNFHLPTRILRVFFIDVTIFCFIFCLLIFNKVLAQDKTNFSQSELFNHIDINFGLSQNSVQCAFQDHLGFIWVGTEDGLNRFDGNEFKVYKLRKNYNSLSENFIRCLYEDSNGNIWIGTKGGGLNMYDRRQDVFYSFTFHTSPSYSISQNDILSIADDNLGSLWIGTRLGLFKFDKHKRISVKIVLPGFELESVTALHHESRFLWIGTENKGVLKYEYGTQNFSKLKMGRNDKNEVQINTITKINLRNADNVFFVGTRSGLFVAEQNSLVPYPNNSSILNQCDIRFLSKISDHLWVGTHGDGLFSLDLTNHTYKNYHYDRKNEFSLSSDFIFCGFSDSQEHLWIGTEGAGINRLNSPLNSFNYYSLRQSDMDTESNIVWAIEEDTASGLWVGTRGGSLAFIDYKTNKLTRYSLADVRYSNRSILSLQKKNETELWVGTEGNGLYVFNIKQQEFKRFNLLTKWNPNDRINIIDLHYDKEGNLWVAVEGIGLFCVHETTGTTTVFTNSDLQGEWGFDLVNSIYDDRMGNLWIGTWGYGLQIFDRRTKTWNRFIYEKKQIGSIGGNNIFGITESSTGDIWVGTSGGLCKFNEQDSSFTVYTQEDGLASNVVYNIIEDADSNLWMSTNNGISMFDMSTRRFFNYDKGDGLQSNEFNSGAFLKSQSGKLFFGGINGITSFFPKNIHKKVPQPNVTITDISVNGTSIGYNNASPLKLYYQDNTISFKFAVLDFDNPKLNQYQYALDGFNDSWIRATSGERTAHYENLSSGAYTFRVRGAGRDGLWGKEEKFDFYIDPPFWQTTWFFLGCIFTGVLTIAGIVLYRIRSYLRMQKFRETIARELHDQTGAGLTEIVILANEATQKNSIDDPMPVLQILQTISQRSNDLITNFSDVLWIVNPINDSAQALTIRLSDYYSDILSIMNIKFRIENLGFTDELNISMESRRQLFLIFKEAIHNCIKHSHCREMYLCISKVGNLIRIKLVDDGIGYDEKTVQGMGIGNMKKRAASIGGQLLIYSTEKTGTTVEYRGKLK